MPDPGPAARDPAGPGPRGSAAEVLRAFLKLGLTSFGGPVAHFGYFRTELVERRRWLDDRDYADLVALCQFLPGPTSSQVGMALGLRRAGWAGCLAAWLGFTLPSAVALIAFAHGVAEHRGWAGSGWVLGLKVAAVAVVAQAVWNMGRTLCPDRLRAGIAIAAALVTLAAASAAGQVAAIVVAGLLGRWFVEVPPARATPPPRCGVSRRAGVVASVVFVGLLVGLPLWAAAGAWPGAALLEGVYRSGALVFGGGHVVLPLLQAAVVPQGAVSQADFMAGYGAAQAVPGPLFSIAAYLGAVAQGPLHGWPGGLVLLTVIFTPGFLLLVVALPFWERVRRHDGIRATLAGIDAGVVGVLGAALYDPVWTSAIRSKADFGLALAAFGLLLHARVPPAIVMALAALAGWALAS